MSWDEHKFTYGIDKKPPCKDCGERYLGCHGSCQRYLDYKAKIDDIRESRDKYISAHIPTFKYAKQTNRRKRDN